MSGNDRAGGAGAFASEKGTMVIASTDVALSSGQTATGTFAGAKVGDNVSVNPRANLNGFLNIAYSRVFQADGIVIGFTNSGASTNTGAATFDVEVNHVTPGADLA